MKSTISLFGIGLAGALLLGAAGCAGTVDQAGRRVSNAELVLVSFGQLQGEVAPCG